LEKGTEISGKIGLFGGTFNPVHLGHLRAAEEIRERYALSKIIFIPSHIPPHKKSHITPSENRLEMLKKAVADNPFFAVSRSEIQREGRSYFFETINYFKNLLGDTADLYFIIGQDAFIEINTWKQYPHFFSSCNFIIMSRSGLINFDSNSLLPADIAGEFAFDRGTQRHVHQSGTCIYFCKIPLLEISSTAIRKKLMEGSSTRYLLPRSVEKYIENNNLNLF